jgi:hypothetical protein
VSITDPDIGPSARCDVLIKGNTITGNGAQGVNLAHNLGGIRVVDNTIASNAGSGVLIDFANRWSVSGNVLRRNGERGLAVQTRSDSPGDFGQIVDNQVWDNGQSPALPSGGPGIVISAMDVEPQVMVAGNIFGATLPIRQTVGIETHGPHDTVTLAGNRSYGIPEVRHI